MKSDVSYTVHHPVSDTFVFCVPGSQCEIAELYIDAFFASMFEEGMREPLIRDWQECTGIFDIESPAQLFAPTETFVQGLRRAGATLAPDAVPPGAAGFEEVANALADWLHRQRRHRWVALFEE